MDLGPPPRRSWARRRLGGIAVAVAAVAGGLLVLGGYAAHDGTHVVAARGAARAIGALYLSGDMGLRFGTGPSTTATLADHGITVTAIASPVFFKQRRDRAEVDAVVAQGVRDAVRASGHDRIVAIGRSYGADIIQTGLADLPQPLRRHVAAVILVVPGDKVYFQSDPTSLGYAGTPDSVGATSVNRIDWAPVTCIYGAEETDSLCPDVMLAHATIVRMPGGHFLHHDQAGLFRHLFAAIDRVAPHAQPRG